MWDSGREEKTFGADSGNVRTLLIMTRANVKCWQKDKPECRKYGYSVTIPIFL